MPIKSLLVLSAEFPAPWQTYIVDQGRDFAALGVRVGFVSTRRPAPQYFSEAILTRAGGEFETLFPPAAGDLGYLVLHPVQTLRMLRYLARARAGGMRGWLRRLVLLPSAARLIRLAKARNADLVHLHSFGDAAHVAAIAERACALPYSLTLHGATQDWGGDITLKGENARHIFAVTRALAAEIADLCPGRPVSALSMGIDIDRFGWVERPDRAPGDTWTLCTIARLHPGKGHVQVLEAVRRLRDEGYDLRYLIAGSGQAETEIREAIARLQLEDAVQLLGPLSGDEVAALMQRCDIKVLASLGEAAPVSVMEAMATGLPVICSRVGGTPDMIEDGKQGLLVPPGDITALTDALRRLVGTLGLAAGIRLAARQKAVDDFDSAKLTARVYEALATD
ncbi:glycosyltransferase family 4 protein [Rhodobacter sp. SY28-1]|uniref:glycosyltransferase family 4 protein n=1 Tax=Rhodobacter sp. SY28-1 TaxID=2562317 RepID=UPI0010C02A4E|nr:glycosyltransferase family 4 protein [Rhodobacter sp. SY28-1]